MVSAFCFLVSNEVVDPVVLVSNEVVDPEIF